MEIDAILNDAIEQNYIVGAQVGLFEQQTEVAYWNRGLACKESQKELNKKSIYRMYSMSKPIAAVASSILLERGMIHEEDKLCDYLPEFAKMIVHRANGEEEEASSIRLKHLLNMTAGIVYPDTDYAGRIMEKIFRDIKEKQMLGMPYTTRQVVKKISECPLCAQPGERWRYGLSVDVMGAVVEVVTGQSYRTFLKREIFDKLEMSDTDFYVPKNKQTRFVELYKKTENGLEVDRDRHLGLTLCLESPTFESAGAGLVSTYEDYCKFIKMLLGKGTYQKTKILESTSVEAYTRSALNKMQERTIDFPWLAGYGYGHFMRCWNGSENSKVGISKGEFGWDGWTGPYVAIDLQKNRALLIMLQISAFENREIIEQIRQAIFV